MARQIDVDADGNEYPISMVGDIVADPVPVAHGGTGATTVAQAKAALGIVPDPVPIANGGTGAATLADAQAALGIVPDPVPIANGGTGATTLEDAKAALGIVPDPVPIANGGTGATTAAQARTNLGITGGITEFTYLVDSDQKLSDWANNTKTDGQDYTSVLIAPGTWTSAVQVNLTTSGTKVVVGMPGSKLSFTSQYGLRYTTTPTTTDYRMEGVTAESSNSYDSSAIRNCTNLTNCTGSSIIGFSGCTNLTGCIGTGNGENGGFGFSTCTNLTGCIGTGTSKNEPYVGAGFSSCTNLRNCTGRGLGPGGGPGYGFYYCNGLFFNKPGSASKTATYFACNVSLSGSGGTPAATAAGGWNVV
jgi:hypothetical protein